MTTIKLRRGTASEWASANPVLANGEPGFEKDTGKYKLGDGTTAWNSLPYFIAEDKLSATFAGKGKSKVSEFGPDLGFSVTNQMTAYIPMLLLDNGTIYGKRADGFEMSKSTNDGASWTLTTAPEGNNGLSRMWRTPGGAVLAATSTNKVWRTADEGATWTNVWSPTAGVDEAILEDGLLIHSDGYLYAGVYCGTNNTGYVPRVLKSTDDGVTWTTIHSFGTTMAGQTGTNVIRHIHGMHTGPSGLWAICGDTGPESGMFQWDGTKFVKKSPNLPAGLTASKYVALSVKERNGAFYWAEDSNGDRAGGIYKAAIATLSDETKLVQLAAIPTSGWYTATDSAGNILVGGALETGPIDDGVIRLWAIDGQDRVHEVFSAANNTGDTLPKNILSNLVANSQGKVIFTIRNADWHDLSTYFTVTGFLGMVRPGPGLHPRRGSSTLYQEVATLPFPATFDPAMMNAVGAGAANTAYYARVIGSPVTISKIGLVIGTASGNISVGVYSGAGKGRTGKPSKLKGSSGAVACPAAGYAEVPLSAPVTVQAGDWLAISVDNATATFLKQTSWSSQQNAGRLTSQNAAHPLPTDPAVGGSSNTGFLLIGVP